MNYISKYGYMLLAMFLIIGYASAQGANGNATHSLTVLPRPNTTVIINNTYQPQVLPPPASTGGSEYNSNATIAINATVAPNASAKSNAAASPASNPVSDFLNGIATFFSNLFK